MPRAYLVIHKIAWYNDEFYIDFTDDSKFANPAGLFGTLAEAQAFARRLTREAMRGAYWYGLLPDLETLHALDTLAGQPNKFGLQANFQAGGVIPHELTDGPLDELIELLGIKLFYVLEEDLMLTQVAEGQTLLDQTPIHPEYSENYNETGVPLVDYGADEAAQRLNRVTQLFGRSYADGIVI